MAERPGGEPATRPLHVIWIADCSGSMAADGKIQALNAAIRGALPHLRALADENPKAEVLVRALAFASGARWHCARPTPVADFQWTDLSADGLSDLGQALRLVAEQIRMPPMPERGLPPVLILISNGHPTDDVACGLAQLMQEPWGAKAARIALAIGNDADTEVLQRFIGNPELKPLLTHDPESLIRYLRWAIGTMRLAPRIPAEPHGSIPAPPAIPGADDVW